MSPRAAHAIADIRFSLGLLVCACGWRATPDAPAGLTLQYQAHRREVGERNTDTSDMARSGVGYVKTALSPLARRTRRKR